MNKIIKISKLSYLTLKNTIINNTSIKSTAISIDNIG